MRTRLIGSAAVAAVLLSAGAAPAELASGERSASGSSRSVVRMGAVLNYLDNPFFVAIYAGTRSEASRVGVRATVRSVTSNADVTAQAAQVRAAVAAGADCFVVNPITATNLVGALRGVKRPIVNVDSPVDPAAVRREHLPIRTYIGTNDYAAGRLGGVRMAAVLHDRGNVALIGGIADNVNSGLRLDGFVRGVRGSGVRVVARVNADYDRTKATIAAEQILRAHPRLSGFFTASDNMALGVADAVRASGKSGKIKVVGIDGSPETLQAIRAGTIDASVSQYPYVMGQMAVEACAAVARGATLPARVDAPIALLTRANVARAIAAFPKPFLPYSNPFKQLLRRQP